MTANIYPTTPPQGVNVCPHCKRRTARYAEVHPAPKEIHVCPEHGVVPPMKSAVFKDYPGDVAA